MFDQNLLNQAKDAVSGAKSIAILLPPEPTTDAVAAGLGLFLTLSESGKQAQIGCGSEIKVENADLFGVDRIKNSIGNQNLIISFDFKEENLKKVDYDVDENGRFMLLIQPQPGCEPPDTSSINYSYSGANADLVFVFGINSLEELGKIYADEKAFLDKANIISLNQTSKPSNINCTPLHTMNASSLAEMVAFLLKSLEQKPTPDAASNLLSVISSQTNQFSSPKATADTFETVAFLMRAGGHLGGSPLAGSSRFGAFGPRPDSPFSLGQSPFGGSSFGMGGPSLPPTFDDLDGGDGIFPPLPPRESNAFSAGGPRPADAFTLPPRPQQHRQQRNNVPKDWKKPKIFKSAPRGVSTN